MWMYCIVVVMMVSDLCVCVSTMQLYEQRIASGRGPLSPLGSSLFSGLWAVRCIAFPHGCGPAVLGIAVQCVALGLEGSDGFEELAGLDSRLCFTRECASVWMSVSVLCSPASGTLSCYLLCFRTYFLLFNNNIVLQTYDFLFSQS